MAQSTAWLVGDGNHPGNCWPTNNAANQQGPHSVLLWLTHPVPACCRRPVMSCTCSLLALLLSPWLSACTGQGERSCVETDWRGAGFLAYVLESDCGAQWCKLSGFVCSSKAV